MAVRGRAAEKEVQISINWYAGHKRMLATYLPIMHRQVRADTFLPVRPSPFDFMGVVAGGRGLAIEVKSSAQAELTLGVGRPTDKKAKGLKFHQLAALAQWHEMDGLALLLWRNGDEWMRLPAEELPVILRVAMSSPGRGTSIGLGVFDLLAPRPACPVPFLDEISGARAA